MLPPCSGMLFLWSDGEEPASERRCLERLTYIDELKHHNLFGAAPRAPMREVEVVQDSDGHAVRRTDQFCIWKMKKKRGGEWREGLLGTFYEVNDQGTWKQHVATNGEWAAAEGSDFMDPRQELKSMEARDVQSRSTQQRQIYAAERRKLDLNCRAQDQE